MICEQFIYLGFINNEYYFINKVSNKQLFDKNVSKKIYEYLIDQTIIDDANYTVIIFEFQNGMINVIILRHKNIELEYNKMYSFCELKNILINFLDVKIDASFIVNYSYETKKMNSKQLNYDITTSYNYMKDLVINQIIFLKTNCKIKMK